MSIFSVITLPPKQFLSVNTFQAHSLKIRLSKSLRICNSRLVSYVFFWRNLQTFERFLILLIWRNLQTFFQVSNFMNSEKSSNLFQVFNSINSEKSSNLFGVIFQPFILLNFSFIWRNLYTFSRFIILLIWRNVQACSCFQQIKIFQFHYLTFAEFYHITGNLTGGVQNGPLSSNYYMNRSFVPLQLQETSFEISYLQNQLSCQICCFGRLLHPVSSIYEKKTHTIKGAWSRIRSKIFF